MRRIFFDRYGLRIGWILVIIAAIFVAIFVGAFWVSRVSCDRQTEIDGIDRQWDTFAGCVVVDADEDRVVIK